MSTPAMLVAMVTARRLAGLGDDRPYARGSGVEHLVVDAAASSKMADILAHLDGDRTEPAPAVRPLYLSAMSPITALNLPSCER